MLTLSYINTALSQSAFRIYKCYIIIAAKGSTPNLDMKVSHSLNPVFRADLCIGEIEILCLSRCRNSAGGGGDGGGQESARKILNCVHIICKLFTLDLKMQNIRILPEETRLAWLYFFVLISIKAMNCLTFILEASNVLLFIGASYSLKYPIVRMLV